MKQKLERSWRQVTSHLTYFTTLIWVWQKEQWPTPHPTLNAHDHWKLVHPLRGILTKPINPFLLRHALVETRVKDYLVLKWGHSELRGFSAVMWIKVKSGKFLGNSYTPRVKSLTVWIHIQLINRLDKLAGVDLTEWTASLWRQLMCTFAMGCVKIIKWWVGFVPELWEDKSQWLDTWVSLESLSLPIPLSLSLSMSFGLHSEA